MPEDIRETLHGALKRHLAVPRQISRPAMVALTWAGLIEWQTIKVPAAVQVGPGPRSRGLRAS